MSGEFRNFTHNLNVCGLYGLGLLFLAPRGSTSSVAQVREEVYTVSATGKPFQSLFTQIRLSSWCSFKIRPKNHQAVMLLRTSGDLFNLGIEFIV